MKKQSDENLKSVITSDPKEIFDCLSGTPVWDSLSNPFTLEMLTLLKESNPFKQTYYYIEQGESYAFFIVYESRMNIMTLGKSEWMMNVTTIGFPCSFSNGGYITNDLSFLLSYCKRLKGGKLILNVESPVKMKGMGFGETLPTCVLDLHANHTSLDGYVNSLRSPYRRRIRLALRRCSEIEILHEEFTKEKNKTPEHDLYSLYLNTYNKSEYKLECLTKDFFDKCEGHRIVFLKENKPVGFVLLHEDGEKLSFLFCGMDYETFRECADAETNGKADVILTEKENEKVTVTNADLYFCMLLHIVEYAIERGCKTIDFGQTSELTKMKFGAHLEKRYFYAQHTNPFLNLFAILGKGLLEYKYHFPDFNVFRE